MAKVTNIKNNRLPAKLNTVRKTVTQKTNVKAKNKPIKKNRTTIIKLKKVKTQPTESTNNREQISQINPIESDSIFRCASPVIEVFHAQYKGLSDKLADIEKLGQQEPLTNHHYHELNHQLSSLGKLCSDYNMNHDNDFDLMRYECGVERLIISPIAECASQIVLTVLQLIHHTAYHIIDKSVTSERKWIEKSICHSIFEAYEHIITSLLNSTHINCDKEKCQSFLGRAWDFAVKENINLHPLVEGHILSLVKKNNRNAIFILGLLPQHPKSDRQKNILQTLYTFFPCDKTLIGSDVELDDELFLSHDRIADGLFKKTLLN